MKTESRAAASPARRRVVLALFAVTALLSAAQGQAASAAADLPARVDACMASAMGEDTPGAALAVVWDGELSYEKGYGVKRRDSGEPVTAQTLFRTGSIQKMMTAAAVLAQADLGRLRLDEPVTRLVPELSFAEPGSAEQVRIRHLLTHSAGVPNLGELSCGGDDSTLSQWAGSLGDVHLFAYPGAFWNYSNAGYSLAGLVAERAAGLPYREVMRQTVWEPAGMRSTFQLPQEAIAYGDFSHGHWTNPQTGQPEEFAPDTYECWWGFPAGAAFTTAGDLARWANVLMHNGRGVLSRAAARALQASQIATQNPLFNEADYGFGVFVNRIGGMRVLSHGGGVPGWTSKLVWVPERRFAVSVVANATSAAPELATRCVLQEALGIAWPELPHETTPPRTWYRYTGAYLLRHQAGPLVPAQVRLRGRRLSVRTIDPETGEPLVLPLQQIHRDTFFVDIDGDGMVSREGEIVTFIETRAAGQPATMWIRSDVYVGWRVGAYDKPVDTDTP
jgi:CubicO group peptidase (beta-lactamase class C family)